AAPGWTFSGWSGDLNGSTNPVTLTMDGDKEVTATFTSNCVPISGTAFSYAPSSPFVNDAVLFTGTVSAGTTPIAYTWDFGDGSAVQTGNPITHVFPITYVRMSYTVVMTARNGCPSSGTASHVVTVRPRRIFLPILLRNS
ncbi:MAG TPA: PKD domain-containing protein, partial [Anaerolineae bacterium]|nr:PKD domain-containing protein [Anaerolineae bacterium]